MKSSEPPRKHHFAPVFYLSRWAGRDGEIEQFHKPYLSVVKVRRLPPSATGFKEDLYTLPGLAPDLAQQVESGFMQTVDSRAAEVLASMEAGYEPVTSEARSDWTRFLLSLQLRTPSDIVGIKARVQSDWGVTVPQIQERYGELRDEGDPLTFEEFVEARDPRVVERAAVKLATVLMDHEGVGRRINNMVWEIIEVRASNLALLTSDRAVDQVLGLGDAKAFLTLPLGPNKLFIAANRKSIIEGLAAAKARDLVMHRNRSTVKLARDYVWAQDRAQSDFIRRFMGAVPVPTLGERLAADRSGPGGG